MNKKQEEFILYLICKALSIQNYSKRDKIKDYVYTTFKELGDME